MWIFCKSGFFSVVAHNGDPDLFHVRARFRGDLERLCSGHGIEPRVAETPQNDYPFRMDFKRDDWKRIMAEEIRDIDYTNFKAAVHDGTGRDDAYLDVWAVLRHHSSSL